jgi:hypothetical protein
MASKAAGKTAKTATEALKVLWEAASFRTWKKKADIEGALANRDNHFSGAELGTALMRATHLTRKGKSGNYEYIQKYPYVQETAGSNAPKR